MDSQKQLRLFTVGDGIVLSHCAGKTAPASPLWWSERCLPTLAWHGPCRAVLLLCMKKINWDTEIIAKLSG